ncbi:MAG: class I SAM-dependent methyltransferase, partial [Candidatus Micrarchaeota archaeon]
MDETQRYDIELEEIVPEYRSKNAQVRKLFFKRLETALGYLRSVKPAKVLDAGCGDGMFTDLMRKEGYEAVGVDCNVHTEELNKKYEGIRFIKADLHELPFKDGEFDCMTCLDVLEHFSDAEDVLVKLKSKIRPGGHLVVSGPVESFWYKLGRFITKGSFSQESGPGAGKHYYNISQLDAVIRRHFKLVKRKGIGFLFVHLFDVNLYEKSR